MKINGSCHCGAIEFEAELDPAKVGVCHCTDCQSLSASSFRTVAVVTGDQFSLTKGTPKHYVKTAESGNKRIQAFCGECGSGLYACEDSETPAAYNVRVGTLRQRADLVPTFEFWKRSALSWLPNFKLGKSFEKMPN